MKARNRVKEQIAKDKADRAARLAEQKAMREGNPVPVQTQAKQSTQSTTTDGAPEPKKVKVYDSARIQIRLPGN